MLAEYSQSLTSGGYVRGCLLQFRLPPLQLSRSNHVRIQELLRARDGPLRDLPL
jgi:hypothetical protein